MSTLNLQNMNDDALLTLTAYGIVCLIVSAEAKSRGWNQWRAFLVSILTTPIVGAILFSPFKPVTGPVEGEDTPL